MTDKPLSPDDLSFRKRFDSVIKAVGDLLIACLIVALISRLFGQSFTMATVALSIALVAFFRTQRRAIDEVNAVLSKPSPPSSYDEADKLHHRLQKLRHDLSTWGYHDHAHTVEDVMFLEHEVRRVSKLDPRDVLSHETAKAGNLAGARVIMESLEQENSPAAVALKAMEHMVIATGTRI